MRFYLSLVTEHRHIQPNTSDVDVDKNSTHVTLLEVRCALDHSLEENVNEDRLCSYLAVCVQCPQMAVRRLEMTAMPECRVKGLAAVICS